MARVARGRPRPVHPSTSEIFITEQDSVELVKTAMTAAMIDVVHARGVFPHVNWEFRTYDPAASETTYSSFVNGESRLGETGMVWRFAQRNQDPNFDRLIQCIESGAHDALMRKHLSKLQLSFHAVDGQPSDSNLIESYTMGFTYQDGAVVSNTSGMARDDQIQGSQKIMVFDSKREVKDFIDNILFFFYQHKSKSGRLRDYPLPSRFQMVMSMQYREDTPANYKADCFRNGDEHIARLLDLGELQEHSRMRTAFHRVSFGAILPGPGDIPTQPSMLLDRSGNGLKDPIEAMASQASPSSSGHHRLRRGFSQSSDLEGNETQPGNLRMLQEMGTFRDPLTDTQDTRPLQGLLTQNSSADREATKTLDSIGLAPYTQEIRNYATEPRELQHDHVPAVNCPCGVLSDDQNLIKCAVCLDLQHAPCYGYIDNEKPNTIVCYPCLFKWTSELELANKMIALCLKRRAVYYLRYRGSFTSLDDLATYLAREVKETKTMLNQLKNEGYVKSNPQSKKRKDKSIKPLIMLVADEDQLRGELFNPQWNIQHHFAISAELSTEGTVETDSVSNLNQPEQSLALTRHDMLDSLPAVEDIRSAHIRTKIQKSAIDEGSSTQDTSSPRSVSRYQFRSSSGGQSQGALTLKRSTDDSAEEISAAKRRRSKGTGVADPWLLPN